MKKTTKLKLSFLSLIVLAAGIAVARIVFAAGTATLSLTPATGTFSQGDTVSVNIYEDSGSDTVNAVQANFSYPGNLLSFVGITDSPAFGVVAQNSGGGGSVHVARGSTTAVAGSQLVATVRFTALAGGQADLSFAAGSAVVRSTDNGAETLTTTGASYTLNSRATLYITPSTKTFNIGNDISAAIYEDSGGTPVNAVQANLSYPSNITFASIDAAGSAFPIAAQGTGGGGLVKVGRGTTTPVTGPQLVAIVHFTAAAAGTASIPFATGSTVVRSSDNGPESLTETGAAYTISSPTSGGGGSTTTTPPKTTTTPKTTKTTPKTSAPSTATATPQTTSTEPPVTTNIDDQSPDISNIGVTNLTLKTATITWETSEPATSEVDFGLNDKYILNAVDTKLTKTHSVAINSKDLMPHTTYHFQIKSVDGSGNLAISKDQTFKTELANSKSKVGNFWAAFAVIVIIAAGAFVGAVRIRRMKQQALVSGPQGPIISNSSRQSGGTVITPEGSSGQSPIAPNSVVAPNEPARDIPKKPPAN